MSMLLYRLGGFIDRARVWVVVAWLLLLTALIGASSMLGTHYDDTFTIPGTQSQQGQDVLADRFGLTGTNGQVLYTSERGPISAGAAAGAVGDAVQKVNALAGVAVSNPLTADVPEIRSIADLNEFVGRVRSGPAFQGADVGADVTLQDGRRLWVFGDTLRSADFSGQRFVRNSMLVFDGSCAHAVVPADHGALIPDRPDGIGYWPMSIARQQRDGYDVVGIAAQRVRSTNQPDGAFAFENLGSSIALFAVLRGKVPQLIWHKDLGPDDADTARPQWGAAAAVQDGWVYLYGTARPDRPGVFGFSLRVARTRMEGLLEPDTWQYWDGKRWQGSPSRAVPLIDATRGVSQTLSVFPRGGRWYAVSKRDEFLGTDLTIWSAPSPKGPFDDGRTIARIPSNSETGQLRYMPLAHPDLSSDPSTIVISYSRNNTDTSKVVDNPFLYRPQFLEAPLPTGRQQ